MVSTASAAAHASTVWMTRRVRVASLAHSTTSTTTTSNDHHKAPSAVVRPPNSSTAGWRLTPLGKSNGVPLQWLSTPPARKDESIRSLTESISARIQEKYAEDTEAVAVELEALNRDVFWSKFSTLTELGAVESKRDILKIISTFQFIGKKSVFLFSKFSRKIIANKHEYSANEIAEVMHAFAQLGFLEESFCLQLSERLMELLPSASAQAFVWVADGFATTRCSSSEFNEALLQHALLRIDTFNVSQVSLLLSSLARLSIRDEYVYTCLGSRLTALTDVFKTEEVFSIPEESCLSGADCSARDVTLTAYAFAKMKVSLSHKLTETIIALSKQLIRDFTSKELQMLMTAMDRFDLKDAELFAVVSLQAQRRIAQFSSESLIHFLKAMVGRSAVDSALTTRVVCQLPRLVNSMKASDLVALYQVFQDMGLKSQSAMEAIRGPTISKSGQFSSADWITILGCAAEIASPEISHELIEAFTLVNVSPANYRSTTSIINATVISRMTIPQLVLLTSTLPTCPDSLSEIIFSEIERRGLTASDASDVYCGLVELNMHENPKFKDRMRILLSNALKSE